MTAVIPVTGSTYHPRTPTPLTNFIHLQLGETTHREKPLSHDLLAKLVRHITFGKPRRAESATSDRHSRVRQSPFPSHGPLPPSPSPSPLPRVNGRPQSPSPTVPAPLPSSRCSLSLSLSLSFARSLHSPGPLTPTWFFLLSSEERASPPKRKEKQQRAHAPQEHTVGEGDATMDPVTNDHYSSTAQSTTPRPIFSRRRSRRAIEQQDHEA